MWSKIQSMLEGQPERLKVVRIILENGLGLRGSEVYLNDIEIPVVRIAKLAGVDRRTVDETIRMIERNPEFKALFSNLGSAGLSLRGGAKQLGLGVVESIVEEPHKRGSIRCGKQLVC